MFFAFYNATIFSLLPNYYFFSFFMTKKRNYKKKAYLC